jgi:hypothetical protein
MKIRSLLLGAVAALSGLVSFPNTASAQVAVTPYTNGDIFLGFRALDGTGASTAYLVNLGQVSQFTTAANPFSLTSIGNIGLDLVSIYGSDWNTREDVRWGIFGASGSGTAAILYGSRERTSPNTPSTPWPELTGIARSSTLSDINAVRNGYNNQGPTTVNSTRAITEAASRQNGYVSYVDPSSDFGTLSQWSSIEGSFANGTAETRLDLHRVTGSVATSVSIGTFAIGDSGVLTFTPIPEPGTVVLFGLAGVIFFFFVRRRKSVTA